MVIPRVGLYVASCQVKLFFGLFWRDQAVLGLTSGTKDLLALRNHSRDHMGIKSGSATCKASALPIVLLSSPGKTPFFLILGLIT